MAGSAAGGTGPQNRPQLGVSLAEAIPDDPELPALLAELAERQREGERLRRERAEQLKAALRAQIAAAAAQNAQLRADMHASGSVGGGSASSARPVAANRGVPPPATLSPITLKVLRGDAVEEDDPPEPDWPVHILDKRRLPKVLVGHPFLKTKECKTALRNVENRLIYFLPGKRHKSEACVLGCAHTNQLYNYTPAMQPPPFNPPASSGVSQPNVKRWRESQANAFRLAAYLCRDATVTVDDVAGRLVTFNEHGAIEDNRPWTGATAVPRSRTPPPAYSSVCPPPQPPPAPQQHTPIERVWSPISYAAAAGVLAIGLVWHWLAHRSDNSDEQLVV